MSDVPVFARTQDWPRKVSEADGKRKREIRALEERLEAIEGGLIYPNLAAAPGSPVESQTYYDTVLQKVRTYAGGVWNDHW